MSVKTDEQTEAVERLREWLKPGDTVYCVLRHVSRSGMFRIIDLVQIENGEPRFIGAAAAKAMDWRYDFSRNGLRVSGAGMDMGFHAVYSLARTIFRDDDRVEDGDAGYALEHRWL